MKAFHSNGNIYHTSHHKRTWCSSFVYRIIIYVHTLRESCAHAVFDLIKGHTRRVITKSVLCLQHTRTQTPVRTFRLEYRRRSRPARRHNLVSVKKICEFFPARNAAFSVFLSPSRFAVSKMSKYTRASTLPPLYFIIFKKKILPVYSKRPHHLLLCCVSYRFRGGQRWPSPLPRRTVHVGVVRAGRRFHTSVLFLLPKYVRMRYRRYSKIRDCRHHRRRRRILRTTIMMIVTKYGRQKHIITSRRRSDLRRQKPFKK